MVFYRPDLYLNRRSDWPAEILSFSFSTIFEVSIIEYNVSVNIVGIIFDIERVRMLLG